MMSLKSTKYMAIPEETVRIAKAAFPKGNLCIWLRDEIPSLFSDDMFVELYPRRGQPSISPSQLALITIFQFAENLTDRQAADAVRGRIDWKYALGIELSDPGFNFSVLSEFRTRLIQGGAEARLFEVLLSHCKQKNWLKQGGKQRTDSTHIVGAIRALNQLELIGEAVRHALNTLTHVVPDWLQERFQNRWLDRYQHPLSDYRLPADKNEREQLTLQIGQDGLQLLEWVYQDKNLDWLRHIPAIEGLRRIWVEQFYVHDEQLQHRTKNDCPPTGNVICSPYDTDARYARKRNQTWIGYRLHLSETCEDDYPNLITNVMTTGASIADIKVIDDIHDALASKQRLPDEHIVDSGYVSSDTLVSSQRGYEVDLIGPVRPDNSWQASLPEAYDISQFTVDWEQKQVICPQGSSTYKWKTLTGRRGKPVILAEFPEKDCRSCSMRELCTKGKRRTITMQLENEFKALREARIRQQSDEFSKQYAIRAGVEGTISQAAFAFGSRQTRYRGEAKVHLEHLLVATAINVSRIFHWNIGTKRSTTRKAVFTKLSAA